MIFFSFAELKNAIEDSNREGMQFTAPFMKELFSQKIGNTDYFSIGERKTTPQELFFLLDQYELEENRVFSDWIVTDQVLLSFLNDKDFPEKASVQRHEGHFLQEKYFSFVAQFLYTKLKERVLKAIKEEDLYSLIQLSGLKRLLPKEDELQIDKELEGYLHSIIEKVKNNKEQEIQKLLQPELAILLNSLREQFYATKILFIECLKDIIEQDEEQSQKAISAIKRVDLHDAHKKEVRLYLSGLSNTKKRVAVSIPKLLRTPLFYLGLLIIALLVYILLPKNTVKPIQTSGLPTNRTGLDSLSLDEIKTADSLLGHKSDSVVTDNEEFYSTPLIDQYQMIDGEDTLRNNLARALSISMTADYKIQNDQNDSQDCNPMSMGEKKRFQMDGVQNIEDLSNGFAHKIRNRSSYDLYILLFENNPNGKVYGSFIPSKGEIKFEFQKGMRLIVYSGKELTKFNPLQHKNGGYGSIIYAKRIDQRFTAHFCSLNEYNLQLMSKSWSAVKNGGETLVSSQNGPIRISSEAFEE